VALDHVAQRARAVVVARTTLQGQVLIEDDFYLGNVVTAPDRLQEIVGEPQAKDVQDGGLAQEMVHPVDVVLRNKGQECPVELAGRLLAGAEGLLHDQTGPGGDLFRAQDFAGLLAHLRRQGEVDRNRPLEARQEFCERAVCGDVGLVVFRRLCHDRQRVPAGVRRRFGGSVKGGVHAFLPLFR
jgi:hypothetical protein